MKNHLDLLSASRIFINRKLKGENELPVDKSYQHLKHVTVFIKDLDNEETASSASLYNTTRSG